MPFIDQANFSNQYQNSAASFISKSSAGNPVSDASANANKENPLNQADKKDKASNLARNFILTGHSIGLLTIAGIFPPFFIAAPLAGMFCAVAACAMQPAEDAPQENKVREEEEKFQLKKLA
jgi:hypothetical protein